MIERRTRNTRETVGKEGEVKERKGIVGEQRRKKSYVFSFNFSNKNGNGKTLVGCNVIQGKGSAKINSSSSSTQGVDLSPFQHATGIKGSKVKPHDSVLLFEMLE